MMEIPEGWQRLPLGDLFEFKNGYNTDKSAYGSGTPFVNVMEVFNTDKLYLNDIAGKVTASPEHRELFSVIYGDVLFNRTSETQEDIAMTTTYMANDPAIFGGFVIRGRQTKKLLTPEFSAYCFQSAYIRKAMVSRGQGAIRSNIGQKDLIKVPLLVPPVSEQRLIANILATWDRAIAATEALIAQSEAQKTALMQQLLTGKRRLPRFEGDWQEVKLEDVANIVMGSSPKSEFYNDLGDGLPLLQGNADIKNGRSSPRIFTSEITKVCEKGDVLLSVRAPVGTIALSDHKACIGRGVAALRAKNGIPQSYIFAWLKHYEWSWTTFSQGSTFEAINSTDVKNRKILMSTDSDELTAIAAILSNTSGECLLLKAKTQTLKTEKAALMQQLLTGKRRVKLTEVAV